MRISSEQSQIASSVTPASPTTPAAPQGSQAQPTTSTAESPAATVTLSDAAQTISQAKQAVAAAPDIREDLVSSLKAKIDSGTYNVSSSDIAEMMLRRHSADHSAS